MSVFFSCPEFRKDVITHAIAKTAGAFPHPITLCGDCASHELAEIPLIRLDYSLPVRMGFVKGAKHNASP